MSTHAHLPRDMKETYYMISDHNSYPETGQNCLKFIWPDGGAFCVVVDIRIIVRSSPKMNKACKRKLPSAVNTLGTSTRATHATSHNHLEAARALSLSLTGYFLFSGNAAAHFRARHSIGFFLEHNRK